MWQPLPAQRLLPSDVELANSIQRRWIDLARWLNSFLYSEILELGNREATSNRLTQLADNVAWFYTQYYGPVVGTSAQTIYQNYFFHVKESIRAYKNQDTTMIEQLQYATYQDAYDLAKLLSGVNRYLDEATLQAMLLVLVDNTEKQIQHIVNQNFEYAAELYDQYVEQIYRIAAEITYGIIKQFSIRG